MSTLTWRSLCTRRIPFLPRKWWTSSLWKWDSSMSPLVWIREWMQRHPTTVPCLTPGAWHLINWSSTTRCKSVSDFNISCLCSLIFGFDCTEKLPRGLSIKQIVYQRLADHIPMLILLFILKEAAVMLRAHTMDLRDGADVVKLLIEDSEAGRKRVDLHQRMQRLRLAQERISIYLWDRSFLW